MKYFLIIYFFCVDVLACKPCSRDSLGYSYRNNNLIFLGTVSSVGDAPADILKFNKKSDSMYDHKSYCLEVTLKIKKIFKNAKKIEAKEGTMFKTKNCYSPPCKGIQKLELGKEYLFFPENYGNCSQFAYPASTQNKLQELLNK